MVRQRPWLPSAVAVTADPDGWTVAVQEAGSAEELMSGEAVAEAAVPPGGSRAVYELTAVVALIRCGVGQPMLQALLAALGCNGSERALTFAACPVGRALSHHNYTCQLAFGCWMIDSQHA